MIKSHATKDNGIPLSCEKADIFMVGATVFSLLFGHSHFPISSRNPVVIGLYMVQVFDGPIFLAGGPPCGAVCQIFFSKILNKNPEIRLNISQAFADPWLQDVSFSPGVPTADMDLNSVDIPISVQLWAVSSEGGAAESH